FDSHSNDWIAELTHRFSGGGVGQLAARYSDRKADYNYAFGGSELDINQKLEVAGTASHIDQQALSVDASYSKPFEMLGNISEFVVGADFKRYDTDSQSARAKNVAGGRITVDE